MLCMFFSYFFLSSAAILNSCTHLNIADIQGPNWKKPRFRTHAKMRWDDKYLYIGAFLQETDVWANQTKHDSVGKM